MKAQEKDNRHGRYINREFSWLQFNARVLHEAENNENPLLERCKFLSIFESNLDEFYMVRVSGLIEQSEQKITALTPDGLTPDDQLDLIAKEVRILRERAAQIWKESLHPALAGSGIVIRKFSELNKTEQAQLTEHFQKRLFNVCTPLMLDPNPTFPFISNLSLNLAVELKDEGDTKLARVKIPSVVPRLIAIPQRTTEYLLLEDLIAAHLHLLFPGVEIINSYLFRVVRDADIEIRELEAADLISAIEQTLNLRRLGDAVLLEVDESMPRKWRLFLEKKLRLDDSDVLIVDGQLGMDFGWELSSIPRDDLKFKTHTPFTCEEHSDSKQIFPAITRRDILLHHPFDSFAPVEMFVNAAAEDQSVVGIKQTLYRVGSKSPIVEYLMEAGEKGKQVAVLVELKARFDEHNNLSWARALERVGVHVSFGSMEMKVHCKLCLIVRNEPQGIKTYVHIGTGNYNPSTARIYTDLGLLTDDPEICQDISELFNYLTGLSKQTQYRKLLVAPLNLREGIIDRIEREVQHHANTGQGRIIFKLNSLVDPEVIDALYEASQAGVKIDLIVRGICCLRPGIPGLSENIQVVSIVGRFLEHSRIYYFNNGGNPDVFIGSADMMRRNLDRRIEALAPVSDPNHIEYLCQHVLEPALIDNVKGWVSLPTGEYQKKKPGSPEPGFSSQNHLIDHPATKNSN